MKRTLWALCLILLAGVLVLSSCDDFFSSSWGTEREYDPAKIDINAGNYEAWLSASKGNPKLAAAITEKLKGTSDPTLKSAGVKLAVESAGLGTLIIQKLGDLTKLADSDDPDSTIKGILGDIQNNFTSGSPGNNAANTIVGLVGGANVTNGQFTGAYGANASASEVAEAMMVLALAVSCEKNLDFENDNLKDKFAFTVDANSVKYTGTDPKLQVLSAYANLVVSDTSGKFSDNAVTKALKDAFTT